MQQFLFLRLVIGPMHRCVTQRYVTGRVGVPAGGIRGRRPATQRDDGVPTCGTECQCDAEPPCQHRVSNSQTGAAGTNKDLYTGRSCWLFFVRFLLPTIAFFCALLILLAIFWLLWSQLRTCLTEEVFFEGPALASAFTMIMGGLSGARSWGVYRGLEGEAKRTLCIKAV